MHEFWADELAEKAIARHDGPYVVSDWKTPSGHVHVGSLRGVLVHDAVARALKSRNKEVRYVYGFDDMDPFDKVPSYLDRDAYAPYLGKPFPMVPAPDESGKPVGEPTSDHNYARYYADEFEAVYRQLGVVSETLRSSELYQAGLFNDAIRIALDAAAEIRAVYESVVETHRSEDRREKTVGAQFPINVLCESCGRIATTEVTAWDGEQVTYVCRDGVAAYVAGCGNQGAVSPFDGHAKLPWKVEWAAKWWLMKSDVEGAGKDHYTKGGSHDVSAEIFRRVFAPHAQPGFNQIPEDLFYEWFYLGGKKMSTSKGIGIYARDILAQVPAELLRFLMVRVKPKSGVDFDATAETVNQLFDEYDRVLHEANGEQASHEAAIMRAAVLETKTLPDYVMRFRKLIQQIQLLRPDDSHILAAAAEEKGSELTTIELHELNRRLAFARTLGALQPDQVKVQLELPEVSLSTEQQAFLRELNDQVATIEWTAEAVQSAIHAAKEASGVEPRAAFQAIYRSFLNRDAGPQAGQLLSGLDREFVQQRLVEASRE